VTGNSIDRASSNRSAGMSNFNEEAFQECLKLTEGKGKKTNDKLGKQPQAGAKEGLDVIRVIYKKNPVRAREIFNSYMHLND